MKQYIRANSKSNDLDLFYSELHKAESEINRMYPNLHVHIGDRTSADNKLIAGVSWTSWGIAPTDVTREIAEALLVASDMCDDINNSFDIDYNF